MFWRHSLRRLVLCLFVFAVATSHAGGVNLQEVRISREYRYQLTTALRAFTIWLTVRSLPSVAELAGDKDRLVRVLTDYLQYLFDQGGSLAVARQTVLALQTFHRHLKGQLLICWDSIRSWEQLRPCSMRVPIPHLVVEALFTYAIATGFKVQGQAGRGWICFGVGVLCCFSGLLRPGELAALCPEHVSLPGSGLHGVVEKAVVCVKSPKTRRSLGRQQVATISDSRAIAWLGWLTRNMDPGSRIFPGGTLAFRRYMNMALEALDLSSAGFTPGGLRAGGTTFLFISGVEVARIRILGRWKIMETLDHYVQEASAALALIRLPQSVIRSLTRLKVGASGFATPPDFSWECFFQRTRQSAQWTSRLSGKSYGPRKR